MRPHSAHRLKAVTVRMPSAMQFSFRIKLRVKPRSLLELALGLRYALKSASTVAFCTVDIYIRTSAFYLGLGMNYVPVTSAVLTGRIVYHAEAPHS